MIAVARCPASKVSANSQFFLPVAQGRICCLSWLLWAPPSGARCAVSRHAARTSIGGSRQLDDLLAEFGGVRWSELYLSLHKDLVSAKRTLRLIA